MVTFPQYTGPGAVQRILKGSQPDGTNGDKAIDAYDPTKDTPFTTIGGNNIAFLQLETPLALSDSKIFNLFYFQNF